MIEPPADEYDWVKGPGGGATVVVGDVVGVVGGGEVDGATAVVPGAAGALVVGDVVDDAVPVGGIADGTVVVGTTDVLGGADVTTTG